MAGAFGGDDEEQLEVQGENPDGDKSLEVQDDPAYRKYDKNDDEEPDYHGGEENFADENNMNRFQKKIFQFEEKRLKPKLKKVLERVHSSQFPFLNPIDKRTVEKAKAHKNLKTDVDAIDLALGIKKVQLSSKVMSIVAPAIPIIFMAALLILGFMVIVAFIGSIMPWLFPDDDLSGGSSGGAAVTTPSAQFGVTGKDFYGVRTIYSDNELAKVGLLEEYSSIIDDTVEDVLEIKQTKTEGGTTYTVTVKVNLTIPKGEVDEDGNPTKFDYSTFKDADFKATYSDYYNLLNEMAKIVYTEDNPTGVVPENLSDKLNGILYFGLNDDLNEDLRDKIHTKLLTMYTISISDGTSVVEKDSLKTEFKNNFENKTTSGTNNLYTIINNNLKEHNERSEKLFIKDYTFASDEDMMNAIAKENYVAWIFMPKKQVEFKKISFYVTHPDYDNFNMKLFNNNEELNIKKDEFDFSDFGDFDFSEIEGSGSKQEKETETYAYIAKNLNVSASSFEYIGTDVNSLIGGVSLAKIVSDNLLDEKKYLTKNDDGIYTFITSGVYVTFESEQSFNCVEFETIWK